MSSNRPLTRNIRRYYSLLAVANKELADKRPGWCDDDYRMILQQCGAQLVNGKPSATTMTIPQMEQALTRFKALGFRVRKRGGGWRGPRIAKLNAMWCAMADAGVVTDRSQAALEVFLKARVEGFKTLAWTDPKQLNQCVEIVKAWALRADVDVTD